MSESTKKLEKEILSKPQNGGVRLSEEEVKRAEEYAQGYKSFLDAGKTEREATSAAIQMAEKKGFVPFEYGKKYAPGDKIYYNNRGKSIILAVMGREPIENGVNLMAAHIDSPRIDLKAHPLYEKEELALFKTHYYGGIRKYQWVTMPLALHGVIIRKDGQTVTVHIGEDEGDPIFCITDLLPHLSAEQNKRTLSEGIKGEELNILIGSYPLRDEDCKEPVKLNIMRLLHEKYGLIEDDFISAELSLVPAFKARDLGFDRSMIGAYGHDDRVCAYTALTATLDTESPARTVVTILTDKEEIGSVGNTGLNSAYLEYFIADLAKPFGIDGRRVLAHSKCLSADVNVAVDPTFTDVTEPMNASRFNRGVVVTKFTGSRGKSGTSDASAEFVSEVRQMLDKENVVWQTGELGRVDLGGGGTVALYIAALDVDVIDVGVPVLSMHAPFEIVSKIDVYSTYRAFRTFAEHTA